MTQQLPMRVGTRAVLLSRPHKHVLLRFGVGDFLGMVAAGNGKPVVLIDDTVFFPIDPKQPIQATDALKAEPQIAAFQGLVVDVDPMKYINGEVDLDAIVSGAVAKIEAEGLPVAAEPEPAQDEDDAMEPPLVAEAVPAVLARAPNEYDQLIALRAHLEKIDVTETALLAQLEKLATQRREALAQIEVLKDAALANIIAATAPKEKAP